MTDTSIDTDWEASPVAQGMNWARRRKRDALFYLKWCLGMRTPWCGWLDSTAFIDADGSVYSCCHQGPGLLGNLYRATLMEIWNGAEYSHHRRANNGGRLPCACGCKLLAYADRSPAQGREGDPARPPYSAMTRLLVQFGYKCNIRCIMCEQDHGDATELDLEVLRTQVDYTHVSLVVVQGGEPFCIKGATEFIRWVSERGIRLQIMTNGTIMSDALAGALMANNNDISISLNAATPATHERVNRGSQWDKVMGTIRRLREARDREEGRAARIVGHMTIVHENIHEVPLLLAGFRSLGFDAINFGYDKAVPPWLREHSEDANRLRMEIARILATDEHRDCIETSRLVLLGLA